MLQKINIKVILIYIILLLFFLPQYSYADIQLKKVTLQLSWFNQFQFAGYYIAKEKGYYKQAGFDVEIIPFQFGLDIPSDVASNKVDFAIGRENLILDRVKNKKLVALYALYQVSPLILISKKSSNIKTLADFHNKRIMTTINDASEVSLKAMLTSSHVKNGDYIFLKHTHHVADLVDGKTDIMSAYISKAPFELQELGIDYNIFSPKEYGFDMYSDFLYTSESFIQKNQGSIEDFKEASLKGWQYAYSHIEEATDLILKKYNTQSLSKKALLYEAKELKKLSFYKTDALGKIEKNKLQRIYDLYNVMGFIPNKINIDDFVFNQFGALTLEEKNYLMHKKEIKVCSDPNWMPFEAIQNGQLRGISVDYLQIIEKKINTPFSLVPTLNWNQSLQFAKERKCDILSLSMPTPERKKYLNFTKPYLNVPLVIATTTDKFFITDIKEVLDKKIGMVKGYSSVELLKRKYPNINIVEVDNIEEGLKKVAKGELYGFIDSLITIGYIIQKEYLSVLKIGGKLSQFFNLGIATRNDEPLLESIMGKALDSIDESTKQDITNKWVNVKFETGVDYSLFRKLVTGVILIFLVIMYRYIVIQKYNNKIKKNMEVIDRYVLFIHLDAKGIITDISKALCELSGYKKEELLGQSIDILYKTPDNIAQKKVYFREIQANHIWEGEIKKIKKDGTIYWVHAKISAELEKNGDIIGYRSFQSDITDKKRIEEVSHTDQLTQIYNRLYLDISFNNELSRASRYKRDIFSTIMMDIDDFKDINDTFGHTIGDKVLIELVNLIKYKIRVTDIFGRWGGEEFLILCPNTNKDEALNLTQKIRVSIEEHVFISEIKLTCSFGVTQYQDKDDLDSMFLRADKALYGAKDGGKNTVITL